MKQCTKCLLWKPLDGFAVRSSTKSGRQPKCKSCNAVYRSLNRVAVSAAKQRWSLNNLDRSREIKKSHFERNKGENLKRMAEWKRNHPEQRARDNVKRRVGMSHACVSWANRFFIEEAYRLARLRTEMLGFEWQVDHIVPLRSSQVCGLHVGTNFQVIPASDNMKKGNRFDSDWVSVPSV